MYIEKIQNPAYHKAFINYLRFGTAITVSPYVLLEKSLELEYFYIWRTREDAKVRPAHAALNGKVFDWKKPTSEGYPGQAYNCRCPAEEINATCEIGKEKLVNRNDTRTWPTVPIDGKLIESLPSREDAKSRGNKSYYDIYGGEWKPHTEDERHNLHWDYKAAGPCLERLKIPINNIPTDKSRSI